MRAGPAVRPARSCQVLPVTTNRVEIEKERLRQRGTMGPQPEPAACKARSVLSGDEIVTYEWECVVGTGSKTSLVRVSG